MITIQNIQKALLKKGYNLFEDDSKEYNLNLVGVRSKDVTPNTFNDWFTVFWKHAGEWHFYVFKCTTDPGLYWLNNPMNDKGTGILKEGQYSGLWTLGFHKGKYMALKQKNPCTLIRDYDRDSELDFDSGREDTGIFGINGHRANAHRESVQIDKWSAGCQVIADPDDFEWLINTCKKSSKIWGDSFTYTLLNESDL